MSYGFSNIPGEIEDIISTCVTSFNYETTGPVEDYDMPTLACQLCHRNSLTITVAFINEHGKFYKMGHTYQINTSHRNTHICYHCLDNMESTCLD